MLARDGAGLPSLFGMPAPAAALAEWRCVPPAVIDDTEQLRRLFLREANRMPEVLHLPARQLVYYAVAKAFPCGYGAIGTTRGCYQQRTPLHNALHNATCG